MDGKWQEEQDQRAIQSRDVNKGSHLVTWVTSCSSRQPLPNLWTSLVRAEPQRSPAASADHHIQVPDKDGAMGPYKKSDFKYDVKSGFLVF